MSINCLMSKSGKTNRADTRPALQLNFLFPKLFLDCHFVNEVFAVAELFEDEQHVADVKSDATLKVVIEIDVTTQRLPVSVESATDEVALAIDDRRT